MEKWEKIKDYEELYEISNMGRVRRIDSMINTAIKNNQTKLWKGRILKQNLKRNGYLTVDLSKDGKVKTISVHKIVATAFLKKENEGQTEVNHINCNKKDNRVENLEWVTPQENKAHAKENNLYNPVNRKKIRCKQLNMIFESSYNAAEYINRVYFGNSKQTKNVAAKIRAACLGYQKVAYGFTWEDYI